MRNRGADWAAARAAARVTVSCQKPNVENPKAAHFDREIRQMFLRGTNGR